MISLCRVFLGLVMAMLSNSFALMLLLLMEGRGDSWGGGKCSLVQ
jgi:hypothetical protein